MSDDDPGDSRIARRAYLGSAATATGALTLGAGSAVAGEDDSETDSKDHSKKGDKRGTDDDHGKKKKKGSTEIDQAGVVIDEPGYYELTADLSHDHDHDDCDCDDTDDHGLAAIEIRASDVTLDGCGHGIVCEDSDDGADDHPLEEMFGTAGILVRPPGHSGEKKNKHLTDVTVTDVTVEGCDTGIGFYRTKGGTIDDAAVHDNERMGVGLARSADSCVESTVATDNGHGFLLVDVHDSELRYNNPAYNDGPGFTLAADQDGTWDNVLTHNRSWYNAHGFQLQGANDNYFARNEANENDQCGMLLTGSAENVITRNEVEANGDCGICFDSAHGNRLMRNQTNDNGRSGVCLTESDGNAFVANASNDNAEYGFHLVDSDGNAGPDNAASGNGDGPICIDGGDGNEIEVNDNVYLDNMGC
ncbi:NosD domain-containing protein [Halovivax limisalsi]|uniref:NosD domain-containing protein n=1 Tax=Halovivax limisalsi TaxID=1453760 RepID=UPI001FFC7254|nr:NosD domain-containing protein [Halovivax limisalsi]